MIYEEIVHALQEAFTPEELRVTDESSWHNVPPGTQSHFRVLLVAPRFAQHPLLERHRLVYDVLKSVQQQIHALALELYSPEEWRQRGKVAAASPPCRGGSK